MKDWEGELNKEDFVEAIDEGRIVRVPESYAKREGLPILRKPIREVINQNRVENEKKSLKEEITLNSAKFSMKQNPIIKELIDNFHWEITKKRKIMNITRKRMADSIGVSEEDLKLLENGVVRKNDFILINKVENYLKINLRKPGNISGIDQSMRKLVESNSLLDNPPKQKDI